MLSTCQAICCQGYSLFCFLFVTSTFPTFNSSHVVCMLLIPHLPTKLVSFIRSVDLMEMHLIHIPFFSLPFWELAKDSLHIEVEYMLLIVYSVGKYSTLTD